MRIITYVYICSVCIAWISSLRSFRLDFPFHLKLFSCLLGLTALVELTAFALPTFFHIKNNWLYNSFTLVEFWTYAYFYSFIIRKKILKGILLLFMVTFPVFWFITVFYQYGFFTWNSSVIVVGSFFSVLLPVMYYYQIITETEIIALRTLPEFWIATGMLIFYLGSLPFFGMLNFLGRSHASIISKLYAVLTVQNIIMYSLFTYAFLCRTNNTMRS
ncbi:MAG TPA: hypothetical protein VHT72_12550 [Puia sp.]|nr:hypothetical protein [Puia sp.]